MKLKLFIPAVVLLLSSFNIIQAQKIMEVNSKEVSTMLQKDTKLVVLDVRTAEEFNDGHVKGAINIDIRQPDALNKIDKLDRNAKYIVHCRTKHRSKMAVDHMLQSGFKNIYQMMDGYMGWAQNGLPAEK